MSFHAKPHFVAGYCQCFCEGCFGRKDSDARIPTCVCPDCEHSEDDKRVEAREAEKAEEGPVAGLPLGVPNDKPVHLKTRPQPAEHSNAATATTKASTPTTDLAVTTETICKTPDCNNPVTKKTGPGRPPVYCTDCRSTK